MGLDQYLRGEKFFWNSWGDPSQERKEDGLRVESLTVDLGYWRKHPDLHGYIVQTFAEGRDECQKIPLEEFDIEKIIEAVRERRLPHTTGFFFGASDGSEMEEDIAIFEKALEWLRAGDDSGVTRIAVAEGDTFRMEEIKPKPEIKGRQRVSRSIYYRASW